MPGNMKCCSSTNSNNLTDCRIVQKTATAVLTSPPIWYAYQFEYCHAYAINTHRFRQTTSANIHARAREHNLLSSLALLIFVNALSLSVVQCNAFFLSRAPITWTWIWWSFREKAHRIIEAFNRRKKKLHIISIILFNIFCSRLHSHLVLSLFMCFHSLSCCSWWILAGYIVDLCRRLSLSNFIQTSQNIFFGKNLLNPSFRLELKSTPG